jgi:peptidoglycan hydrolase CwlO-like protein
MPAKQRFQFMTRCVFAAATMLPTCAAAADDDQVERLQRQIDAMQQQQQQFQQQLTELRRQLKETKQSRENAQPAEAPPAKAPWPLPALRSLLEVL